jgi:hypothetical protein
MPTNKQFFAYPSLIPTARESRQFIAKMADRFASTLQRDAAGAINAATVFRVQAPKEPTGGARKLRYIRMHALKADAHDRLPSNRVRDG